MQRPQLLRQGDAGRELRCRGYAGDHAATWSLDGSEAADSQVHVCPPGCERLHACSGGLDDGIPRGRVQHADAGLHPSLPECDDAEHQLVTGFQAQERARTELGAAGLCERGAGAGGPGALYEFRAAEWPRPTPRLLRGPSCLLRPCRASLLGLPPPSGAHGQREHGQGQHGRAGAGLQRLRQRGTSGTSTSGASAKPFLESTSSRRLPCGFGLSNGVLLLRRSLPNPR
mmetsp:Transcript_50801/g.121435  ORF Transcript_50801/g.121435 Transcript_50801/m.121435 type:complete len:229 (+) Transcript_50801:1903-2589(+)